MTAVVPMDRESLIAIVRGLERARVRYLVVGGLAVVAHGYVRFTADLDLFMDLEEQNLWRAIGVFRELEYRPRAPVELGELASAERRREWAGRKGMRVFSLWSDRFPATEVDLFVEPPIDFDAAEERAIRMEIQPGVEARFVGLEDLIRLKELAGRPRDREDIEQLRAIREETEDEP